MVIGTHKLDARDSGWDLPHGKQILYLRVMPLPHSIELATLALSSPGILRFNTGFIGLVGSVCIWRRVASGCFCLFGYAFFLLFCFLSAEETLATGRMAEGHLVQGPIELRGVSEQAALDLLKF